MTEPSYPIQDTHVPHEAEVAEAVDAQMRRTSTHADIEPLGVPSSTYVEAEAVAAAATINKILAVLVDAELIPPNVQ